MLAGGLVDLYRLFTARNWAYSVAQEAALAGASRGRDWDFFTASGAMRLLSEPAEAEAEQVLVAEMEARGVSGYGFDIRVLPSPAGGSIPDFPPRPVRLGENLGDWSADEPAVGVFLSVPVDWLLLDVVGLAGKPVSVFAAAGVAH